jgi:hypothetical protein
MPSKANIAKPLRKIEKRTSKQSKLKVKSYSRRRRSSILTSTKSFFVFSKTLREALKSVNWKASARKRNPMPADYGASSTMEQF